MSSSPTAAEPGALEIRRDRLAAAVLAVLTLAALGLRIWAAWQERVIMDPDTGIVALMASDIAAGRSFPVFFYGQPYMGTLEPAFSALLCRLFGAGGFIVNLGTALLSTLLVPVVYRWGRDAGGRAAGLAAAAFCVIGTRDSFHYMISPRGGYAALVVLTALLLWQTPRLAWRARQGQCPRLAWFLLGLAGGLAWWVHQLSMEVLASSALLALLVAGLRLLRPGVLVPAAAGFLLGSAPFWTWNGLHEFETFRFLAASGSGGAKTSIYDFLIRSRRWFGMEHAPHLLQAALVAAVVTIVCAALLRMALALHRRAWSEREAHLASAVLLLACAAFFFVRASFSVFHTARYFVPLVPAVALLAGHFAAATGRGPWRAAAALPALLLAAPALLVPADLSGRARDGETFRQRATGIAAFLAQSDTGVAFTPFRFHAFNHLTGGKLRFIVAENEHAVHLAREAETAARIAVLANYEGVEEFVQTAGGSLRIGAAGGLRIAHTFAPPSQSWARIPPQEWITPSTAALADGRLATTWPGAGAALQDLELSFPEPRVVAGVRGFAPDAASYPARWSIDGQLPDGTWTNLMRALPVTSYFWSGPRPYCGRFAYRLEARFTPRVLRCLRLHLAPRNDAQACALSELACYGPAAAGDTEASSVAPLLAELQGRGIRRLYADRWIGNEIGRRSGGAIACPCARFWLEPGWRDELLPLALERDTALLVRREDAAACTAVLARAGAEVDETPVGPWILMEVRKELPTAADKLVWIGFGCAER